MRTQAGAWGTAALAGTVLAAPLLATVSCSSGPAAPTGTVTGTYIRVGGPGGTPDEPLPGTISFVSKNATVTLTADRHGKFTGVLPAGRYSVSAKSGLVNSGASACSNDQTARVRTGTTVKITVICSIP